MHEYIFYHYFYDFAFFLLYCLVSISAASKNNSRSLKDKPNQTSNDDKFESKTNDKKLTEVESKMKRFDVTNETNKNESNEKRKMSSKSDGGGKN